MSNHKKGFTLVELLVVIAIIGILSSVVFASLSSARTKAKYASVQSYARALQPAVTLCDDSGATGGTLVAYTAGTEMCSPAISTTWPAKPAAVTTGPTAGGSAGANTLSLACTAADCGTAKTCWVSATTTSCN